MGVETAPTPSSSRPWGDRQVGRTVRLAIATLFACLLTACAAASEDVAVRPAVDGKRIALTFDDVPRAPGAFLTEDTRTERLIAALDASDVEQAAFFLNPGHIENRPGAEARIAAYVAAGHVIANHSNTHPRLSKTDADIYLADIDAAESWLKTRSGHRPWFRFPYLDEGQRDKVKRDAVREGLHARGLSNGYVTVEASDWWIEQAAIDAQRDGHKIDRSALRDLYVESHVEAANFYDELAFKVLGRHPAHVMLLHETDIAAFYIADLVAALRADGWEIITADEAYADPIGQLRPDVPSAQGTLTEAIAWERGLPAPRWYERNDTRVYSRLFRERVLHLEPETP
ncbi:MAG: polysaccharide deacetylase family protein [Altererythrobacter sp.]|nr:polysaccharide deacetylase family protein [Altererythrobacter sp.]